MILLVDLAVFAVWWRMLVFVYFDRSAVLFVDSLRAVPQYISFVGSKPWLCSPPVPQYAAGQKMTICNLRCRTRLYLILNESLHEFRICRKGNEKVTAEARLCHSGDENARCRLPTSPSSLGRATIGSQRNKVGLHHLRSRDPLSEAFRP